MHKFISSITVVPSCRALVTKVERLPEELKEKLRSTAHLGTQCQRKALMETNAALQREISQDEMAQGQNTE